MDRADKATTDEFGTGQHSCNYEAVLRTAQAIFMKHYLWTHQVTYMRRDSDAKDKYTKQGVVNIKRSL